MRRWVFRIAIGVASLIVLVIAAVQLVLWSNLPKDIVTGQIENELGLRISAAALRTSWLGKTELTDVSLGLPLDSSSFLTVKSLRIRHNTLIGLLLGHAISVKSIEIDQPKIRVVQDAQGNWNVQQVVELLARVMGSNSAQQSGEQSANETGVPQLPIVQLIDGAVSVQNNRHELMTVLPLNISGNPVGTLVWTYQLSLSDAIHLTGKLAPGGNWRHQVTLSVHDLDPILKNWGTTYDAQVKAQWTGQLSDGKLIGHLAMQQMTARDVPGLGDISLIGSMAVQSDGSLLTIHPRQMAISTSLAALPDLNIRSGQIISDSNGLRAEALKVGLLGGLVNLDGRFDSRTLDTNVTVAWSGLSLAKKTHQSGSLTASLRQPFAGQPVINLDLSSNGTYGELDSPPISSCSAHIHLTGQGSSWRSIDWAFTAPQLAFTTGTRSYSVAGLTAHVSQRTPEHQQLPVVQLIDLSIADPNHKSDLSAAASIDFNSRQWSIVAGEKWRTNVQGVPANLDFELSANGTDRQFDLKHLSLMLADATVAVDGSYDAARPFDRTNPGPFALHVALTQASRLQLNSPIKGTVLGNLNVVGDLFRKDADVARPKFDKDPRFHFRPYLDINGNLQCSDLIVCGQTIGDVDIKLAGSTATDPGQQPHTQINTTQFQLFHAPWNLSATYPNPNSALQIDLRVSHLKLVDLAKVVKMPGVSGDLISGDLISGDLIGANWVLTAGGSDLNSIDMRSQYHLARLHMAGETADTVDAAATLHDGVLQLNPLVARRGKGSLTTTASLDLNTHGSLMTQTTIDRWPFDLSSVSQALLSAQANVNIDLNAARTGGSGTLAASIDVVRQAGQQTDTIAHAELEADLRNRAIEVTSLAGNVRRGSFSGISKVDIDKPLQATGALQWKDIDGAALVDAVPALVGLGGTFSGTVNIAPAIHELRPLEPVRVDISLASDGGHFRSIEIGRSGLPMIAVLYANTDRAVLDHSNFYIAGGTVHLWSRISGEGGLSDQTLIDFDNLDLDQLMHADPAMTQSDPGILSGHLALVRSGPGADKLLAIGHVDLNQTDLAHVGPIAALYDVMHVSRGGSRPAGNGSIDLDFEQNTLHVSSFRLDNRGVEARGVASVGPINYTHLGATVIGGQVVGDARPFKDISLPLLDNFDDIFTALQGGLTPIDILGTVAKPRYVPASIANISAALRQLIVGDARASRQAGQQ